jgi:hypothetical protein
MKRDIRQRCAFGCVVCGLPIYEYEHMTDYAKVLRHEAHNITLLCDRHHGHKTKKLLSEEQVRAHDADPYNRGHSQSAAEMLHYEGNRYSLRMGEIVMRDCWFNGRCILLLIDHSRVIEVKMTDGQLFFDLDIGTRRVIRSCKLRRMS